MSVTTYTDLVSAVTEWIARDGDTTLVARIPDFITLTEAKLNRLLKTNQMEKRSTTTVDTTTTEPEFITLPTDFQAMRRIRLSSVDGKPGLQFLSVTQADDVRYSMANASGQPQYFSIIGNEIELIPTPDQNYTIEMVYRANLPPLGSTTAMNWLITLAPDLYLYGALLEAAPYLQNDERIPVWSAAFAASLNSVNDLAKDQSFNAGPLTVRTGGTTP